VNYVDLQRTGKSRTQLSSGQISDKVGTVTTGSSSAPSGPTLTGQATGTGAGSSVDTSSDMNFWRDLEHSLKEIVNTDKEGRSVVVNSQAGVVIVHAYPSELHQVARYLDRIQSNLERQVIIEAKILEVQLNDSYQAGIDWSLLGNPLTGNALLSQTGNGPNGDGAFSNESDINSFDSMFTINFKGSLRALARLLQTQGNVQVLSSPRISTVNNEKAVIKVGQDEFFVTGVSSSNTIAGSATVPTQDVSLTPFFSGVTLDVTPQISKDGTVILHIHPAVSSVKDQEKNIVLGATVPGTSNVLTLPLALSSIRESDNVVRARNGQVVVIGGLIQNLTTENVAGTPVLSRIPFFGTLFRRTDQISQKTELVILLRPIMTNNYVWKKSLERADRREESMKRNFHLGGLPDVFGNEGEVSRS
jgi:MSHA biogenesis protein MshL